MFEIWGRGAKFPVFPSPQPLRTTMIYASNMIRRTLYIIRRALHGCKNGKNVSELHIIIITLYACFDLVMCDDYPKHVYIY